MFVLKSPCLAIDIDVLSISEGRPANIDCGIEYVDDCRVETPCGGSVEGVGGAIGAKPTAVQYLVGIDVADARDSCLVEQQRLERHRRGSDHVAELLSGEFVDDRIDAKTSEWRQLDVDSVRVEHHDFSEGPGIDKPQLVAVVEYGGHMRMWRLRAARWLDEQLATHAQVHHDGIAGVEREQQVFSAALHRQHGGAGEPRDQFFR